MSKSRMSYNTANKIIDIYSELLMNVSKLGKYERFAYSDLQGYDLIDISNALKLTAAFRIFETYELYDEKINELKKYASEDGSGLMQFFFHFYPDNVVSELKKLNPDDKLAMLDFVKLTNDSQAELQRLFNKEETPDSFLDYCLHIGRSDPNYWGKIYDRIGILWETNNQKDPIYFLIKNGINYQVKENPLKEIKSREEIIQEEKSKNIFKLIRQKLFK